MKRLAAVLLVTACTSMAPRYERPALPVPAQFHGADGSGDAKPLHWDAFAKEPRLAKLVAQALANNRDLRRAALDIEAARQQYRIQRAQRLPMIDAAATVTSARQLTGGPDNAAATGTVYGASVGMAAWEIDLFGRIASLSDAKQQQFLATVETARATRVSLIGELATAWLALAADRSRLAIARDTLASGKRTMELTEQLVGGGTSNRGDYYQAETVYEQARADIALLTAAIAQDRNALELLAGGPVADDLLPDALPDLVPVASVPTPTTDSHAAAPAPAPPPPPAIDPSGWFGDVPAGLASSVLLERPDILAAEHALIAANANIGAARAAFFPSLTLTASGGLASTALLALFTGPAAVFTLAPALSVPLFRGGANRANLAYTEAEKAAMVAAYEGAIQAGFREVSDALATRASMGEQLAAQVALATAATKSFQLAQARYQAGLDTFLTTLVSQRALYAAKNSLVSTQLAALANRVALYRALGGGAD